METAAFANAWVIDDTLRSVQSVLEDAKKKEPAVPVLAIFYDYDSNVTIEVELSAEGQKLTVVAVSETDYQAHDGGDDDWHSVGPDLAPFGW